MADMLEAKDAKKLLGCDDATLNTLVNNGKIRAQRVSGKLMLSKEDVEKVRKEKEDEGTIVLTGDSDDLSIDLGKVVDDSAETIVQGRKSATDSASGTESITFGDELEVVSFDDHGTGELVFDETKKTDHAGQNLSFTDSNTAVMTAVDETQVGATTAPIEFQTSQVEGASSGRHSSGSATRRSARSQRARGEDVKIHWVWALFLALGTIVCVLFIIPYYVISMYPYGQNDRYELPGHLPGQLSGNRILGTDDNAWTSMASGIAGFTVEPSQAKWKQTHADGEFREMKGEHDPQAIWRHKQFTGEHEGDGEARIKDFIIKSVDAEKKTAKPEGSHDAYPIIEQAVPGAPDQQIKEMVPLVYPK